MTTRTPWTPAENAALVSLYFTMLDHATAGQRYNKAAMIRSAQTVDTHYSDGVAGKLVNRSRGSIEAKLMNATAAHGDAYRELMGRFPVASMHDHGYRALANYQRALYDAMSAEITRRSTLAGQSERLA